MAGPMDDHRLQPGSTGAGEPTCLGRTCMKWQGDGELSPLDLQSILARLSEVDAQAASLMECPVDPSLTPELP